ncbi:MAG TPA: MnhB domain-containing protein [Actinomycetota bacterium]|nr:MnhB domain-containing protein [Actinomycetota bacterium]
MTTVLTRMVARLLLVPVLMVAAAILIKGYVDVGDGFAAGVIAALGILLQYLAFGRSAVQQALPVRHAVKLAVAGLLLSLVVAFVPVLAGRAPLQHAPAPGAEVVHLDSLELLTAVAFDVGVFALVLGMAVATIDLITGTPNERSGQA